MCKKIRFILFVTQLLCINAMELNDQEPTCETLRESFAQSTSKFTSCAIDNSRPITMCEMCIKPYLTLIESYTIMTELIVDNVTRCIDNYINLDRLQIINTLYSSSLSLWDRAKCYECFESINGTITPTKSKETITFDKYYSTLMDCINRTKSNDSVMCTTCLQNYISLDSYYLSISNENEKIGVCMDIVDLMNSTRIFWSHNCCKYRRHDEYIFIASSVGILSLTILFYVLSQKCSKSQAPTIVQQTRFAESLQHSNENED